MPDESPDVLSQHLSRVPVHRALIRALEHRLFAQETLVHPVLDIGCGDGHYAAAAFPGGIDVGIDVTEAIVAEARQNGPYGRVEVASGTALPYADESFLTVVSNCVIEHIPDIEALVREVSRVLAPGGRFIFSVPDDRFTEMLFTVRTLRRLGLDGLAERYGRWWNGNAAHYHLDSPQTWSERLARYGLTIDRQTYYMSLDATRVFRTLPLLCHSFDGVAHDSLAAGRCDQMLCGRLFAYHWLKPHVEEPWPDVGSCAFFVAHK